MKLSYVPSPFSPRTPKASRNLSARSKADLKGERNYAAERFEKARKKVQDLAVKHHESQTQVEDCKCLTLARLLTFLSVPTA